jgi:hypothetical protein
MANVSPVASSRVALQNEGCEYGSKIICIAKAIGEVAFLILIPLGTLLALYATLPLSISSIVIPVAALGMTFISAFFFIPGIGSSQAVKLPFLGVHDYDQALPAGAPRGIPNRGNNCWMNSLMQLLRNDAPFMAWVMKPEQEQNPFRLFSDAYQQAMNAGQRQVDGESQTLRTYLSGISPISPSIGKQEDPTEALTYLPDLQLGQGFPQIRETKCFAAEARNPSEKDTLDRGFLQVGIRPGVPLDLRALFAAHCDCAPEDPNLQIDGHRIDREKTQFVTAPPSLWIQLKRFVNVPQPWSLVHVIKSTFWHYYHKKKLNPEWHTFKREDSISVPNQLPIHPVQGADANYRLDSFLVHVGSSRYSGHYISYTKVGEIWYQIDDAKVRQIGFEALPLNKAYLFHYSKVGA